MDFRHVEDQRKWGPLNPEWVNECWVKALSPPWQLIPQRRVRQHERHDKEGILQELWRSSLWVAVHKAKLLTDNARHIGRN